MKKSVLRSYANLIAKKGANVQKGQEVFLAADLDQPEFVKMVAEECYKLGAKKVVVDWNYQPLTKIGIRYQSLKTLSEMDNYEEARWQHYVDTIPCRIYVRSADPDGMKGVNQEKMAKSMQAKYPTIKKYSDQIENRYQWTIAAVPGVAWAKKLFPELSKKQAVEKLWEEILFCSRVNDDPIKAWDEHNADLAARCSYLNSLGLSRLHYYGDNGTDLTVGLIPQSEFKGGSDKTLLGHTINPNIPSEECFISPMRGQAEGTVYATMPLSYQSQLIEDFSIRFENGKAVEWHAGRNEELLGKMITMDEGAAYLGECALVPCSSPIYQSGILFYNTLFDENAACHLALGEGFADCLKNYEQYSLDEAREMGINDSMIHTDFMIGYEGLNIDGITADGKVVPVFRGGEWAF